jgi:short-subunit dehydrogenase
MPTIAILGAGPGLGLGVAHRYGKEGYDVVLVARREEKLAEYAAGLATDGVTASTVVGDLTDLDHFAALAARIRDAGGEPDVIYFAPTVSGMSFAKAVDLTTKAAEGNNRLLFLSLVAAVQEFLPHMLEQGKGAILTAQGATTLEALPGMSGPGPAMAAQRHYLTSLEKEVSPGGVFVGRLYISGLIKGSAIDQMMRQRRGPDAKDIPGMVSPGALAEKLWKMQQGGRKHEAVVPWFGKTMTRMMASPRMQKRMQQAMDSQ